jgi:hypothetical protein
VPNIEVIIKEGVNMRRQSLVHSVNPDKLAQAKALYEPYALRGRRPAEINDPLIHEYTPLLDSLMPHYRASELHYHLRLLDANRKSSEYFRRVFEALMRSRTTFRFVEPEKNQEYFAVYNYVNLRLSELPTNISLKKTIQELKGIIDDVSSQFSERTELARQELARCVNRFNNPESFYKGIGGIIEDVYDGADKTQSDYDLPKRTIVRIIDEKIAERKGESFLAANIEVAIENELQQFKFQCGEVKRELDKAHAEVLSKDHIHLKILALVEAYGGEHKVAIYRVIRELQLHRDLSVGEYIRNVQKNIRVIIANAHTKKSREDYFQLLQPAGSTEADIKKDLHDKGIDSPGLQEFFKSYFNRDYLVNADQYHENELPRLGFSVPDQSRRRNFNISFDPATNSALVTIIVSYEKIIADNKAYNSDVARSETVIRIAEQAGDNVKAQNRFSVSLVKSEFDIYHEGMRSDYLRKRLNEQNGVLFKLTYRQKLEEKDLDVIRSLAPLNQVAMSWAQQLQIIDQKEHVDDVFLRAWHDELFFNRLFNPNNFCAKLPGDRQDRRNPSMVLQHCEVLQKLCGMSNPLERLDALKAQHEVNNNRLNEVFDTLSDLKVYLELVRDQKWEVVSARLNNPASRELMMSALHSVQDETLIHKMLSHKRILYSLDANTLTVFALKSESIAKKVLHQSIWQRLQVKFRRLFSDGKYLDVPVNRLQAQHVTRLAKQHPTLWHGPLKPRGKFNCKVTGHRNLPGLLEFQHLQSLCETGSKESKQVATTTIINERSLRDVVLRKEVLNNQIANMRVNMGRELGASYEERFLPNGGGLLNFGFEVPEGYDPNLYAVADDQPVEEFFYEQFKNLIVDQNNQERDGGHLALRDEVARLWYRQMPLPDRPGIHNLVKRAMIRVLAEYPQYYLMRYGQGEFSKDNIVGPERELFYNEIFKNDAILLSFIGHKRFRDDLSTFASIELRNTILERTLVKYRACQQGFGGQPEFKLLDVIQAYKLFGASLRDYYRYPQLCPGIVDCVLNHSDDLDVMSSLIPNPLEGQDLSLLLQNASPKQLTEILCQNSERQVEIERATEANARRIAVLNQEIFQLDPEADAATVAAKRLEITRLEGESSIKMQVARFLSVAASGVKNQKILLEKIEADELLPILFDDPALLNTLEQFNLLTSELLEEHLPTLFAVLSPEKIARINVRHSYIRGVIRQNNEARTKLKHVIDDHMLYLLEVTAPSQKDETLGRARGLTSAVGSAITNVKKIQHSADLLRGIKNMIMTFQEPLDLTLVYFSLKRLFFDSRCNSKIYDGSTFSADAAVDFSRLLEFLMPQITQAIKKDGNNFKIINFSKMFAVSCLIAGCTDQLLRQQIWSNPLLQRFLAKHGGLEKILHFLHASQCDDITIKNWSGGLSYLFKVSKAKLLNDNIDFLLENVSGFATWYLTVLNQERKETSSENLRRVLQYNVRGYDILLLLLREHESMPRGGLMGNIYFVRKLLLTDHGLVSRALDNHNGTLKTRDLATVMVKLLRYEIQQSMKEPLGICSSIAVQLLGKLEFMVNHADAQHLKQLLETQRGLNTQVELLPIELLIYAALRKGYLTREYVRDEFSKEPVLVEALIRHSSRPQLIELIQHDVRCLGVLLKHPDLLRKYRRLNREVVDAQLYSYANQPGQNSDLAIKLLPRVIGRLDRDDIAPILMSMLPSLIYQVRTVSSHRQRVYTFLQSAGFRLKISTAEARDLFNIFMHAGDRRAVDLIFFNLRAEDDDTLMAKLWKTLSSTQLLEMMSLQFLPWLDAAPGPADDNGDPQDMRIQHNFSAAMLRSLLKYMFAEDIEDHERAQYFCQRFLTLCENVNFLSEVLQRLTVSQLDKLMGVNANIATKVVAYYKVHTAKFFDALEHGSDVEAVRNNIARHNLADRSQLAQLHELFSHHDNALAKIFIEQVKQPGGHVHFDRIVIDHVRQPADHEIVAQILQLSYSLSGSDFYLKFSLPLHECKTSIFLFYQLAGGVAISNLYHRQIDELRDLWFGLFGTDQNHKSLMSQLERLINLQRDEGLPLGNLSLGCLISPDFREIEGLQIADPQRRPCRSEQILVLLYTMVALLRKKMYDHATFNDRLALFSPYASEEFRSDLWSALKSKCQWVSPLLSRATPVNLAQLLDADHHLPESCRPIRNVLLREFRHANEVLLSTDSLDRIVKNPEAFLLMLTSAEFRKAFPLLPSLYQRVARLFVSERDHRAPGMYLSNPKITVHYEIDAVTKHYSGTSYLINDNKSDSMCNEAQYQLWLGASEFYEFGRIASSTSAKGFHRPHAVKYEDLLIFDQDKFKIKGQQNPAACGKSIPPKFLSCFLYSQLIKHSYLFLKNLETSVAYREAYLQCFKTVWRPDSPEGYYAHVLRNRDQLFPHIELSLSGFAPASDMLVMYCYARYISAVQQGDLMPSPEINVELFGILALDHVLLHNEVFYFSNSGVVTDARGKVIKDQYIQVPPECAALLEQALGRLSVEQRQNLYDRSAILQRNPKQPRPALAAQIAHQRSQMRTGALIPVIDDNAEQPAMVEELLMK